MSSQDINSSDHRRTKSAGNNSQSSSALAFGHSRVQSTDTQTRPALIGLGLSSVDLDGAQKPNVARSQAGIPALPSSQDGPGQSVPDHQGDDALVSAGIRRLSRASAAEQATAFGTLVAGPSRLATIVSTPANIMHGLTDQEARVQRSVSGSYTALPEHAQLQGRREEREDAQSEYPNPHSPVGMGQEMYGHGLEEEDQDEEPDRLEAFGLNQEGKILLTRGVTDANFRADQAQIWDDAVATSATRKQRKEEEGSIVAGRSQEREGAHSELPNPDPAPERVQRRSERAVQLPRLESAAARMKAIAMMNQAQERARRLTVLHGGDPFIDSQAPPFDFPAMAPASQVPASRPHHQEGLVSGRSFCTPGPSNSNGGTHQRVPLAHIAALGSQPFLPQAVDNRGGILDGRSPSIYSVETGHWLGQAAAVDGGPATATFDSIGGYPQQAPIFSGNQSRNPSSSEVQVKSGSAHNELKASCKGKGKGGETVVKARSVSSESLLSTSTKENHGSIHDDLVQGFGSANNKGKGKMTEYLPVVQVGDAVESISETPALPEGEDARMNPRLALPWESPSAPRPPPQSPAAEAPSPGPSAFPLGVSTDVALMTYENYDAGIEGPKSIGRKVKGGLRGLVAGVKGKIKPSLTKEKRPTAPSAASVSMPEVEEEGPVGSGLRASATEFLAGFSSKPRHGSGVTRWPGRVSSLAAHSAHSLIFDSPSLWHAKNKPLPSAPVDRGHFSPYENDGESGVRFAEDPTTCGAAMAQFEKATLVAAAKRANIKCQEAESRASELEHNLFAANAENEALRRQVWDLRNRLTEMEIESDHFEEDMEAAVMAERRDMGQEIGRLTHLNEIARAELDGISQKNVLLNRDLGYHLGTIAELRLQLGQQPQQQEGVADEGHVPYFCRPDLRHKHMGVFHPLSSARLPVGPGHPNFSPTLAPRRPRVKKPSPDNNQQPM